MFSIWKKVDLKFYYEAVNVNRQHVHEWKPWKLTFILALCASRRIRDVRKYRTFETA